MNLTHDIDQTLRDFYRAEMPSPWPTMRAPARTLPMPRRSAKPAWMRSLSRLAVAACIALLLIGYLAVASLFPRENGVARSLKQVGPDAARGDPMPKFDPIPKGFILTDPPR